MTRPIRRSRSRTSPQVALAIAATLFALALPVPARAQALEGDAPTGAESTRPGLIIREAGEATIDDFRWRNRLVVVFADSPEDPRFTEQLELLASRPFDLIERDVIVLTDADPEARSPLRLHLRPRGFQMALIGKDGEVELRKPSPWSSRELSRSIDKMPLRQQEIRDKKAQAG